MAKNTTPTNKTTTPTTETQPKEATVATAVETQPKETTATVENQPKEAEAAKATTEAAASTETTTEAVQATPQTAADDVLIPLTEEMSTAERAQAETLNNYYQNMSAVSAYDERKLVAQQTKLVSLIRTILSQTDEALFAKQWNMLVEAFRKGSKPVQGVRQAFHPMMVLRGVEYVPASKPDFAINTALIGLLSDHAGAVNVKDVSKMIDIHKVFSGLPEREYSRLSSIYTSN